MRMRDLGACIAVACSALSSISHAEIKGDLLPFILAEHERIQEEMGDFHFTADTIRKFENAGEWTTATHHLEEYRHHGDVSFKTSWIQSSPSNPNTTRREKRLVSNDNYAALWRVGNPLAYIYDHKSPEKMHRNPSNIIAGERGFDINRLMFGLGDSSTLAEYIGVGEDQYTWDAVPYTTADNKPKVLVRRHSPYMTTSNDVDVEIYLDSDQGYVVENVIHRDRDGWIRGYVHTTFSKAAPGIYFPSDSSIRFFDTKKKLKEKDTAEILSGALLDRTTAETTYLMDISVLQAEVQIPIGEEVFEWTELGIPEDIQIIRMAESGSEEIYLARNEMLVPQSFVDEYSKLEVVSGSFALDDLDSYETENDPSQVPELNDDSRPFHEPKLNWVGIFTAIGLVVALGAVLIWKKRMRAD